MDMTDATDLHWKFVHEIRTLPEGDEGREIQAAGWQGPGWYFVDETGVYLHGPYETRREAGSGLQIYAASL